MISRESARVNVENEGDALDALDAVNTDHMPRIIERNGKAIAAIVSLEDFALMGGREASGEEVAKALRAAGAWKGLGGEDLAETIHRWREEASERPPLAT